MPLTYIDRSRWEKFHQHCHRAGYLTYYHGPTRHGIRLRSESIPLTTGSALHAIIAAVTPALDPITATREAVAHAIDDYRALIRARGFDPAARVGEPTSSGGGISADEAYALGIPIESDEEQRWREIEHTIAEQSCLVEALAWVYTLYILPQILADYTVVAIEQEEWFVVPGTCTCPLSEAVNDLAAHEANQCSGVVFVSTPDLVLRRRSDGGLEYHEIKTSSYSNRQIQEQWQHRPQFLVGSRGIEIRLGEPVDSAIVHVFIKGPRKSDYDTGSAGYTGPRRQQSHLCYCYHRDAMPPVVTESWAPRWKFVGEDGRNHTLGKGYRREPVWTQHFPQKPDEMSPVEYWVRWPGEEGLSGVYELCGPIPRQRFMEKDFLEVTKFWAEQLAMSLFDLREEAEWNTPTNLLNAHFPQSWDCHPYGSGRCEFLPICEQTVSIETAHESPLYLYRLPHHQLELDQAVKDGLLAVGMEGVMEGDDEEG